MKLDTPREACGIIGVVDPANPVAEPIFLGLLALQHRGQEAAGIAVKGEGGKILLKKQLGLAGQVFSPSDLALMKGNAGIGHVRYSTVGTSSQVDAQPFYLREPRNGLALGHNGNVVNYKELRLQLIKNEICLESRSDAEIIVCLLAKELEKSNDPFVAINHLSQMIDGGYSVVCLTGRGELLAFRDPRGLRPLCYGFKDEAFIVASESVAIDMCGGELKGDIQPGEAFLISGQTVERKQFAEPRRAHCMFEYVYFSRPDSVIESISVYEARVKLGENLARSYHTNVDVIVPVPDTSRPAAEGASRVSGVPVEEGLIKNRYIHRTFITPEQRRRETDVKAKLNVMKSVVKGKRVLLIDDSLVRGTTLKRIVNMVKNAGAKEVHVRLTCPPIISPCFYGIDIATHQELIASKNSVEEIRKTIGADSLGYQKLNGLIEAIGLKRDDMCTSCLTGNYHTAKAQEISDSMKEKIVTQEERVRYIEVGT